MGKANIHKIGNLTGAQEKKHQNKLGEIMKNAPRVNIQRLSSMALNAAQTQHPDEGVRQQAKVELRRRYDNESSGGQKAAGSYRKPPTRR